jgi:hypothetical protein
MIITMTQIVIDFADICGKDTPLPE